MSQRGVLRPPIRPTGANRLIMLNCEGPSMCRPGVGRGLNERRVGPRLFVEYPRRMAGGA
jgi:hypothetical protein